MQLNRVELAAEGGKPAKTYDFARRDGFWAAHRGVAFPDASQAVETELAAYKQREQSVRALQGGDGDGADADVAGNTARLTDAVNSLPELLEQKKNIDMHTVRPRFARGRADTLFHTAADAADQHH